MNQGLENLKGKNVLILCGSYFYAGKLSEVNKEDILLDKAHIVYDTGGLCDKVWKDAQALPNQWHVRIDAIESFGESGK